MTILESSPTLLTICILFLLFFGIVIICLGKDLPGKGSWLVWGGILAIIACVGFDSGFFLKQAFKTKIWSVGWIGFRGDTGAITVGIFEDPVALAMTTLAALVTSGLLLNHGVLLRESRPERIYAALAISTSGVALAWNSLTPWLMFSGLSLTLLGGFVAIGSRWEVNSEAHLGIKFILERSAGFLLAFFGTCILAANRSALTLNQPQVWEATADHLGSTWIGSILLVAGLFIQMQPFPFTSGTATNSQIYPPIKVLLNQIFPAWAVFPLLLRLEPFFVNLGLFPHFGWIALGSSILIIFSGLFQNKWRQTLGAWLAAGLSLSCAFLAFAGPLAAMALLLGVSLGALCLSAAGSGLEDECPQSHGNKKRAAWVKVGAFLGAAAGTGVVGFISATGAVRWIVQSINFPGVMTFFLLVFFLYVLLSWKLTWSINKLRKFSKVSWLSILSLFLWVLLSLGVIWTGSVTGSVFPGDSDRFLGSFFDEFFVTKSVELTPSSDFLLASSLYWGTWLFAFVAAYWTAGRKEDVWATLGKAIPKTSKFISQGYGITGAMRRVLIGVKWAGECAEGLIDRRIWNNWIPRGLFTGIKIISERVSQMDVRLSFVLGNVLRKSVEIPAKILQLVQTGDLQWYLVFALGSGFALLSHFIKL